MLFKKRNKQPDKVKKPKTPHQQAKTFIQAAESFEKSENEMLKRSEKRAWKIAIIASVSALAAITAVMFITPLKSVEPFIVRVDNNTGFTDVVSTLKNQTIENDEILNKYWLSQYIKYREGYNWQTVQTTYDATNLLSSPTVQAQFNTLYESEGAPHKVLKNQYQVIVRIKSISFVENIAQVRFAKQLIPVNPQSGNRVTPVQNMLATIAFTYKNSPQTEANRLINPLGFQVLSYQVVKENL